MLDEKQLDRIKKPFAKGEGTTNPHEAAIFLAKAQQLIAEAGVSTSDVRRSDVGEAEVRSRFSLSRMKVYENLVIHSVADAFGCKAMWRVRVTCISSTTASRGSC